MDSIDARREYIPRMHVLTARKKELLAMMKYDGIEDGICEGYVLDLTTEKPIEPKEVCIAYKLGNMRWLSEDTWNLEHNGMELDPEFVEAALAYIDAKRQLVQR